MSGSPPEPKAGLTRLILVVEDEVLIALELAAILDDDGYRVLGPAPTVTAASGRSGPTPPCST